MEGEVEDGELGGGGGPGRKPVPLSWCLLLNIAQNPVLPLLSLLGWSNSNPWSHHQPLLLPTCSSIPWETRTGLVKLTAGQCHVPRLPPKDLCQSTSSLPGNQDHFRKPPALPSSCSAPQSSPVWAFLQQPPQGATQQPSIPKSQLERCASAARFVPQSPGLCGHTCALLSPTTTDKEQQTPLELKRGEVSHQISPSEGKMGWRERDNKPQAPLWILLSKKGLQQQTHMYKEPLASWLSALASDSSALQLLAVWSPV